MVPLGHRREGSLPRRRRGGRDRRPGGGRDGEAGRQGRALIAEAEAGPQEHPRDRVAAGVPPARIRRKRWVTSSRVGRVVGAISR